MRSWVEVTLLILSIRHSLCSPNIYQRASALSFFARFQPTVEIIWLSPLMNFCFMFEVNATHYLEITDMGVGVWYGITEEGVQPIETARWGTQ